MSFLDRRLTQYDQLQYNQPRSSCSRSGIVGVGVGGGGGNGTGSKKTSTTTTTTTMNKLRKSVSYNLRQARQELSAFWASYQPVNPGTKVVEYAYKNEIQQLIKVK